MIDDPLSTVVADLQTIKFYNSRTNNRIYEDPIVVNKPVSEISQILNRNLRKLGKNLDF